MCLAGGKPSTQTLCYLLAQSFWTLTEDYTIKDHMGQVAYKCKGKFLTARNRQTISDPEGNKLCVFQKTLMSWHANYMVYSFQPVHQG